MTITVTKTVNIKASTDKVWDYVNDLSKWAEWAISFPFQMLRLPFVLAS